MATKKKEAAARPPKPPAERLDIEAFHQRLKAQGVPREHLAFRCVMCGTVQSLRSFERAEVSKDTAEKQIGFSCVGRHTNAGQWDERDAARRKVPGCNWTLGGLFTFSDLIVVDGGNNHPSFVIATPEEAKALQARDGEIVPYTPPASPTVPATPTTGVTTP